MPSNIWNPIYEALPQSLMEEIQLKRFQRIFKHAYDNSLFYQKLYREAGISPNDIKTLADIKKVPLTTKAHFQKAQDTDEDFPYGDLLAVPLEEVTQYHQTTGTTGKPVRFADTWQDWEAYAEGWAMMMCSRGLNKSDRVYIPFPYHLFIAFWGGHYGVEKLGAEVVPGGQTSTEQRVREMKELR